ncbi:MAG: heavy-metal-associated domain-containing protein [Betaproteobacteria bacterium]
MKNVIFKVEGMHCSGCAATIQALLQRSDGVKKASASFDAGEARVLYDPALISDDQVACVIEQAGFRVTERRAEG